jgi:hypothetical protein
VYEGLKESKVNVRLQRNPTGTGFKRLSSCDVEGIAKAGPRLNMAIEKDIAILCSG